MQANLLTIDTLEDPVIAKDFGRGKENLNDQDEEEEDLNEGDEDQDQSKNNQPRASTSSSHTPKHRSKLPSIITNRRGSSGSTKKIRKHPHLPIPRTVSFAEKSSGDGLTSRLRNNKRLQRLGKATGKDKGTIISPINNRSNNSSISDIDDDDDDDSISLATDDGESVWTEDDEAGTINSNIRARGNDDSNDTDRETAASISGDDDNDFERDETEQARNGFYVPPFLKRMYDKRAKRKNQRRREQQEHDEEAAASKEEDPSKHHLVYRRLPVFSGCIAPFAIMLEIPGFTSKWYIHITPAGQENVYRNNPALLDVGLAISFASAIMGNIAILGRFSERLRPRPATIWAWTCFVLHDIINIVALIVFGVIHAVDDGFTYSEAYWMTTASTVASICCTVTLIIDYVKTKDFKNAGSGLTRKQAQLVIVIMFFLAYISITALIFAFVLKLSFLDSLYFSVETLSTIGLGDIVCTNTASRILLFFLASGGIVLLATTVAIARATILEEFQNAYQNRRIEYRKKLAERQEERKLHRKFRAQVRNKVHRPSGRGAGRGSTRVEENQDDKNLLSRVLSRSDTITSHFGPLHRSWTFSVNDSLQNGDINSNEKHQRQQQHHHHWWNSFDFSNGFSRAAPKDFESSPKYVEESQKEKATPVFIGTFEVKPEDDPLRLEHINTITSENGSATTQLHQYESMLFNQRQDIEEKFQRFRKNLAKAQRNEFWLKLAFSAFLFFCFWIVGAAVFSSIEGWSYFTGFYFVYVVLSSIGFGDETPKTNAGRAFFIVWALFGVGVLTILFSVVSDSWTNTLQQRKLAEGRRARKKSKMKAKLKSALVKMLPPKVQEKRMKERKRRENSIAASSDALSSSAAPEDELILKKQYSNSEVTENDCIASPASTTAHKEEDVQEGSSSGSSNSSGKEQAKSAKDITQLHLDLTNTAMEFHKNALGFMEMMRDTFMQHIHEIPEIVDDLHAITSVTGTIEEKSEFLKSKRESVMQSARERQEPEVVRTMEQWLLLHDFESSLHHLIKYSTTFIDASREQTDRLAKAEEENERLESLLKKSNSIDEKVLKEDRNKD